MLRVRPALRTRTLARCNATRSASTAAPPDAYVTGPMFAALLRKTGLSPKALRALDATAQQERRAGRDAFPIAVALSGGADSMALTLLLREHLRYLKIETPLLAITVDHRLRPESSQEAHDVGQSVANRWGVEHVVAQCVWANADDGNCNSEDSRPAKPRSSKLQEEARRYRYALLQRECRIKHVQHLFVAHNLGDQLETMLFRLGRASGTNGLAGIATVAPLCVDGDSDDIVTNIVISDNDDSVANVQLVRPLLSVPKAQLKATCRRFRQPWVDDPSNDKLLFDRIRIRKELERLEAARGPDVLQLFAAFQQSAARAKQEFARRERRLLRQYIVAAEPARVVVQMALFHDATMFDELRVRLVSTLVLAVGRKQTPPRLAAATRLVRDLELLASGKTLTLSGCRITKKARGTLVHFEPERSGMDVTKSMPHFVAAATTSSASVTDELAAGCATDRKCTSIEAAGTQDEDNDKDNDAHPELLRSLNGSERDDNSSDEKLKVIVRVRPLQKREQSWAAPSDRSDAALQGANATSSNSNSNSTRHTATTSLCIQDNYVTWEKNGQVKMLLADAVFPGSAPQDAVFASVQDCVDGLVAGYDCSVFAYGQTGTGKTYTMSGLEHSDTETMDASARVDRYGVVPRSVDRLFCHIERAATHNTSFSLYCSFIEIYNEKIYDILASDPTTATAPGPSTTTKRSTTDRSSGSVTHRTGWNCGVQVTKEMPSLPIRQKRDGSVFVDGLTSRHLTTRDEMLEAFREGSLNREVRDNVYNQHSSRGHSIFQITLRTNMLDDDTTGVPAAATTSTSTTGPAKSLHAHNDGRHDAPRSRLSRLFFVDLAGSEKWHVNGSERSDTYASELAAINKSLSALTHCVRALALTQKDKEKAPTHINFRDSVLTRLCQRSLEGAGRTAFIVTLSPAVASLDESFATLRFAEQLKALRCRPIRKTVFSTNDNVNGDQRLYYEQQIQTMRIEVTRLRELLKQAHRKNGGDLIEPIANSALVAENRRLKELLMHSERTRLIERGDRMNGKGAMVSYALAGERPSASDSVASLTTTTPITAVKTPTDSSTRRDDDESKRKSTVVSSSRDSSNVPSRPPRQLQSVQPLVPNAIRLGRRTEAIDRLAPTSSRPAGDLGDSDDDDCNDADQSRGRRASRSVGASMEQMDTLLSSLHSKEARLHSMLEAEMEAQNQNTQASGRCASDNDALRLEASESSAEPRRKATVTKTWAVEKRLRNLVHVPPPLLLQRNSSIDSSASTPRSNAGIISSAPNAVGSLDVKPTRPLHLQRVPPATARSLVGNDDDALTSLTTAATAKRDSPRQPTRTFAEPLAATAVQIPQRASRQGVAVTTQSAASVAHTRFAARTKPSSDARQSASILQLVGAGDKQLGKSKDALVDDYKRARRAELEAMLRTMVE